MNLINNCPRQRLSYRQKGKLWRIDNVNYGDSKIFSNENSIRLDYYQKKILYDLIDGIIHIEDIKNTINPDGIKAKYIPKEILHYPIINSKINVLIGEELKRIDLWSVKITNPNSVSDIEEQKKSLIFKALQEEIQNDSQSEDEFNQRIQKLNDYYTYEYLDFREVRANCLLNHYNKELLHHLIFNDGFRDAIIVGEEIYMVDIIEGEPTLRKLDPKYVKIFKSGNSHKIEDADMIIIIEYISPGLIHDEFYDLLTKKDLDKLDEYERSFASGNTDNMDNWDERKAFVSVSHKIPTADDVFSGSIDDDEFQCFQTTDSNGNIRVMRMFWKSQRKIKKIKFYDPETGKQDFTYETEDYIPNESKGEESEDYWINEAWEGTKIGSDIFVNIRPRPILFNSISNPSRCHFGIIGTIYSVNDGKPFSLVKMAKLYNYLYDVIHDRLNKMMAHNWGKMTRLNLALKPSTWDVDKWLYYAKTMGLYVEDGFNEGVIGLSTGKLAGAMNMNSNGVIDADFGNNILQYINLLEYTKQEMSDVLGISKQREGLISNRETVGGVERATLLSSHITEWIFSYHDNTKNRVRAAFLEVCKAWMKGYNQKILYITPDYATIIIDIDGDEFAESDYGVVMDNSNGLQELNQKLETLALAALQNQTLSFSTIMKLFMSASLAEKQRFVENDEKAIIERRQQEMQLQQQMQQQLILAHMQEKLQEMLFKDLINQRDNETKVMVAEINSLAEMAVLLLKNHMTEADYAKEENALLINKDKLMQEMLIMDKKLLALQLIEKDKLEQNQKQFNELLKFLREKSKADNLIKLKQINKSNK